MSPAILGGWLGRFDACFTGKLMIATSFLARSGPDGPRVVGSGYIRLVTAA